MVGLITQPPMNKIAGADTNGDHRTINEFSLGPAICHKDFRLKAFGGGCSVSGHPLQDWLVMAKVTHTSIQSKKRPHY